MIRVSRSIFAGAALAMVLAGCQKSDAPDMALVASRTAGQAMARQVKLVRTMMQPTATTAQLFGAAARLA